MESTEQQDAVNISELLSAFRNNIRLILLITIVCLTLGIVYAWVTPVEYRSDAQVMPERNEQSSQFGDLLQNYGNLLGGGGSSLNLSNDGTISPQVYPEIVQSLGFQHQMLQDTVYFSDISKSITLFEYFSDQEPSSYLSWLGEETSGQPQRLPVILQEQLNNEQITSVSPEEMKVINKLRDRIDIEFDTGTGVMNVSVLMPDALAAAQVCNKAINRLTDYLKTYRTQKAQNVLDFTEEQYKIGQDRFMNAQDELATFQDQNVNLQSAKAQSRLKYLQAEFDLAYNVYNSIAQKRIQARMNLQQNTPVFQTVQAANVPLNQAQPNWIAILIFSIAVGFVISFVVIAVKIMFPKLNASA